MKLEVRTQDGSTFSLDECTPEDYNQMLKGLSNENGLIVMNSIRTGIRMAFPVRWVVALHAIPHTEKEVEENLRLAGYPRKGNNK